MPADDVIDQLSEDYMRYGAIPEGYPEDAYHVAIAVVNNLDIVLSWNFRHIVRRKTKDIVNASTWLLLLTTFNILKL